MSPESRIDSSSFRVLLLRRLWLPLPPSSRHCRRGPPLDSRGHHRAACAQVGVLGRRGYALESAAARECREAGARVSTNVMLRDMDLLLQDGTDTRRLEVVADGLPLHHGAQLAIDTTGCLLCEEMVPLDRGARQRMGPRWRQPERGRKDGTQMCRASLEDPVLLSSREKLEDGGGRKHGISCDTWPKPELVGEPFPLQRRAEAACVVVAMARHHGSQRCQILHSVSPRITDVCEQ